MCAHAGFLTDKGHPGHRHRLLTNPNTALAEIVTELVEFAAVKSLGPYLMQTDLFSEKMVRK